jgi:hypothetical protein
MVAHRSLDRSRSRGARPIQAANTRPSGSDARDQETAADSLSGPTPLAAAESPARCTPGSEALAAGRLRDRIELADDKGPAAGGLHHLGLDAVPGQMA